MAKVKYVEERINEIRKLTMDQIPNAINSGIDDIQRYFVEYRIPLNITIIEAVFGIVVKDDEKKKNKLHFNQKRATTEELSVITHLLNDFIQMVENPFFEGFMTADDDDDMGIPNDVRCSASLPTLEKVNNAKIHEYIFSADNAVTKMTISGSDIIELAAVAEKIKRVKTRNAMLLIGGIALVVTGGVIATVAITRSRQKKSEMEAVELDEIPTVDMDEIPTVDMDEIPVVNLESFM